MFELTKGELQPLSRGSGTLRVGACMGVTLALLLAPLAAQTSYSPCDLNQDGIVNAADVPLAINMNLGIAPCSAQIGGAGVCNVAVVQRVVHAALGALA